MAIYLILGAYSNKGAEGLVEGQSNRKAAMETLTSSVGARLLDYHITRGIYDFCLLTESESFNQIAAMNLKAKAAGTVSKLDILESVDIDVIRDIAKKVNFIPPQYNNWLI